MNRQQHPDAAKRQARQVYEAHGSRRAAEVTGISRRTVNAWAKAEGWQRRLATGQAPDQRLHLVAPVADADAASAKGRVPAGYGLARRVLLRRLGDVAGLALDQVEKELAAGHTSKARDAAVVAGIVIDKGEQLAKAAGSGSDGARPTRAESLARLRVLTAELRTRAQGNGSA